MNKANKIQILKPHVSIIMQAVAMFDHATGHNFFKVADRGLELTAKDAKDLLLLCDRYQLQSLKPAFQNFLDQQ